MAIDVWCECGRRGQARDEFAGRRAQCPECGRVLTVPQKPAQAPAAAAAGVSRKPAEVSKQPQAAQITEYLDPPAAKAAKAEKPSYLRLMFEGLLTPQSIQWMLILGGGLTVLGLVIWLTTLGVFKNPYVLATVLGIGTLAVLGAGWWVTLKTRFKIAGQALTFLGCVVAPLNLWFYQAQNLLTIDRGLWVGGVVCCLLYVATVYVLRDPLFMYAVEAGVTLTIGLVLTEHWHFRLGIAPQELYAHVTLVLMGLGLVSLHAERAFLPEGEFSRRRYGMPLFWSGHLQIAAALSIVLGTQVVRWLCNYGFLHFAAPENVLTNPYVAGGLWLVATYAYLYSDIAVRRVGTYTYLAAFCFLLAEVTLVGLNLKEHGAALIAILAVTALVANLAQTYMAARNERVNRTVPPLAMALSALPILLGVLMHMGATSKLEPFVSWKIHTDWWFVGAMVLVAACNRVSAWLCRHTAPRTSAAYFFGSAAATIVAVVALLRAMAQSLKIEWLEPWTGQAPIVMLVPIVYMVASRLWRGHSPERPLAWAAQAATGVILFGVLVAAMEVGQVHTAVVPQADQLTAEQKAAEKAANLAFGLVFAEAAVFYTLAAFFRRRSVNGYFAAAAACGALWQFLHYWNVPGEYQTMFFAVLGVAFLGLCRVLGVEQVAVYRPSGSQATAPRGRGLAAFQAGNAILSIALLAALLQGLSHLADKNYAWPSIIALALTTAAGVLAVVVVPGAVWRRTYAVSSLVLGSLTFLTLTLHVRLSNWQKLEIFCVAAGVLMIAASYIGRFRETDKRENELVGLGLFLGSILATVPLLAATVYHEFWRDRISYPDVLALLTVTIAMLATGLSWQIRSTTLFGGGSFAVYVLLFLVDLGRLLQFAPKVYLVGVYIAIAGAVIFAFGLALSVYREKLLQLPDKIANREGLFKVLGWR